MSSERESAGIRVQSAGKCYRRYDKPHHRLLDALFGKQRHGRDFWAVREASFEVRGGETLGIIGRNGAGKSTLLQMISGVLEPTTGSISVSGKVAALLELGAGFNPEFSGRENAKLNAAIMGLGSREIEERLDDMIEFSELGDFIDQPVKTYSSGMYVRLAFSVAIHVSPAVLIIDEALAVGDARFQAKCMRRINRLKEEGVTILFVSHDVAAIRQLCDRALWLDEGRVRMIGDVLTVTARYTEFLFASDEERSEEGGQGSAHADSRESYMSARPLVRWGAQVGCILSCGVRGRDGGIRDVFYEIEPIEVRIRFKVPEQADRRFTGVALSIKDLAGADLVVVTTLDEIPPVPLPAEGSIFEFTCCFDNCLAPGDYFLTVALEDRRHGSIQYYDYIEGAQYFSVAFQRVVHGRFVPVMRQEIIDVSALHPESA